MTSHGRTEHDSGYDGKDVAVDELDGCASAISVDTLAKVVARHELKGDKGLPKPTNVLELQHEERISEGTLLKIAARHEVKEGKGLPRPKTVLELQHEERLTEGTLLKIAARHEVKEGKGLPRPKTVLELQHEERITEGTLLKITSRHNTSTVARPPELSCQSLAQPAAFLDQRAQENWVNTSNSEESQANRISVHSTPGAFSGAPGRDFRRSTAVNYSLVGSGPNELAIVEESSELAVAAEVSQRPSLNPVAIMMDVSEMSVSKRQRKNMERKNMAIYLSVGVLVMLAIVAAAVALALAKRTNQSTHSQNSTEIILPMEDLEILYVGLPETTKALLLNSSSPQSKAWDWLIQHQNITNLPDWRKQQLFAMATFFHSFEGPNWPKSYGKSWLNDAIGECFWIQAPLYLLYATTEKYQKSTSFDFRPCNDAGEIQTIALTYLDISASSPFIPPEIFLLPSLTNLVLGGNGITALLSDLLPSELLHQLNNLKVLVLHDNNIHGTIPPELGSMISPLEYLMLGKNHITGSIPTEIAHLSELKQLSLVDLPNLEGTLPSTLGLLSKLTDLEVHRTLLTGPIPTQIGLITTLNELSFQSNAHTGVLPSEMGLLTNLVDFLAEKNRLTGELPSELGLLTSMIHLDLKENFLEGLIPSQVGKLTKMEDLQLNGNQFTGSLPSELGYMTNAQRLWLHDNFFSGSIPPQLLLELSGLKTLGLSNLPLLSGTIPENLCYLLVDIDQDQQSSCPFVDIYGYSFPCSVDFDCTASLCGCDCPCFNSTT